MRVAWINVTFLEVGVPKDIDSRVNKRERKNEIFDVLKSQLVNFINSPVFRAADPVGGSYRH